MSDQLLVWMVLGATLVMFVWGRWRYDVVALAALLALTILGIVPAENAFLGFGHPAVVTVGAVLVISRALLNSGAVGVIAERMSHVGDRPVAQVASMTALVTVCSAFMNNVGALAILMPVAIRMARSTGNSPSMLLMPLAFGSLLGGMTTLVGTPPNIIIATFRGANGGEPFGMFDFTPVGAGVALAGLALIILGGWRLIPQREAQGSKEDLFKIEEYMAELRVVEGAKIAGKSIRSVDESVDAEIVVVGLVRGERRMPAPSSFELLREGDILIVRSDSEALKALSEATGMEIEGSYEFSRDDLRSKDVSVVEAIIMPDSPAVGRPARSLGLGWRYGMNMLAIARQGSRIGRRLNDVRLRAGDILLLQVHDDTLQEALEALAWLPLAERGLNIGKPRRIALSVGLFVAAIAVTALGLLHVSIALCTAAVLMIVMGLVPLKQAYTYLDWPVLVLLAAMIPVGEAMETTGGAATVASVVLKMSAHLPMWGTLALLLVATMFLSDIVNNAAAAVLMAPIAFSIAQGMGASSDPFLMVVAVGASCAFLTPIGHQSNTLVMGPGGYRFGDYWRLGLPLEVVVAAVSIPLVLWWWPPFSGG